MIAAVTEAEAGASRKIASLKLASLSVKESRAAGVSESAVSVESIGVTDAGAGPSAPATGHRTRDCPLLPQQECRWAC